MARYMRYLWLKRFNLVVGSILTVPLPALTLLWMGGSLAEATGTELATAWANPGLLGLPIAIDRPEHWVVIGAYLIGAACFPLWLRTRGTTASGSK